MYEREENAQFSLISCSKERRFRLFQISKKKKEAVTSFNVFFEISVLRLYRDYLGKKGRNFEKKKNSRLSTDFRNLQTLAILI